MLGAAVGQRRVRDQQRQVLRHPRAGVLDQVVVGVDRDQPVDVQGRGDVDVDDARVRVRTADERRLQRVVPQVVEVAPATGDQPGVLDARDPLPEQPGRHAAPGSGCGQQLGAALDGVDDVDVAGAPAQVAADRLARLLAGRGGVVAQVGGDGGDEARRAEAALQRMALVEGLLHRPHAAVGRPAALDGRDGCAVEGDREHQAGPHRVAVDEDRAGAADAVLAADVRAGEPQVVPQRVGEQPAGRQREVVRRAVDAERDRHDVLAHATLPVVLDCACATARATSTCARWRR